MKQAKQKKLGNFLILLLALLPITTMAQKEVMSVDQAIDIAYEYKDSGDFHKSIDHIMIYFENAPEAKSKKDFELLGRAFNCLAGDSLRLHNTSGAINNYKQAIRNFKIAGNNELLARAHNNLASAYSREGSYINALNESNSASYLIEDKKSDLYLEVLLYRAIIEQTKLNFASSIKIYNEIIDLSDKENEFYAKAHKNIALIHDELERYEDALDFANKALSYANNDNLKLECNKVINRINFNKLERSKGLPTYKDNLDILKDKYLALDSTDSENLINLGRIFFRKNELNKANEYFELAGEAFLQKEDITNYCRSKSYIGNMLVSQRNIGDSFLDKAEKIFQNNLSVLDTGSLSFTQNLIYLGEVYSFKNELGKAKEYFEFASKNAHVLNNQISEMELYMSLRDCYAAEQNIAGMSELRALMQKLQEEIDNKEIKKSIELKEIKRMNTWWNRTDIHMVIYVFMGLIILFFGFAYNHAKDQNLEKSIKTDLTRVRDALLEIKLKKLIEINGKDANIDIARARKDVLFVMIRSGFRPKIRKKKKELLKQLFKEKEPNLDRYYSDLEDYLKELAGVDKLPQNKTEHIPNRFWGMRMIIHDDEIDFNKINKKQEQVREAV